MAQEAKKEQQDKKGNLILRYELALLYFEEYSIVWDHISFIENRENPIFRHEDSYQFLYHKRHLRPPIV